MPKHVHIQPKPKSMEGSWKLISNRGFVILTPFSFLHPIFLSFFFFSIKIPILPLSSHRFPFSCLPHTIPLIYSSFYLFFIKLHNKIIKEVNQLVWLNQTSRVQMLDNAYANLSSISI